MVVVCILCWKNAGGQVWAAGMEQTLLLSQEWAEQTHGWAGPLTNHPVKTSSTLATFIHTVHTAPIGTHSCCTGTRCSRDAFILGTIYLHIQYHTFIPHHRYQVHQGRLQPWTPNSCMCTCYNWFEFLQQYGGRDVFIAFTTNIYVMIMYTPSRYTFIWFRSASNDHCYSLVQVQRDT